MTRSKTLMFHIQVFILIGALFFPSFIVKLPLLIANETNTTEQLLDIAAKLIQDGSYDKADITLNKIQKDAGDLPRFVTLRGLNFLYQQKFSKALSNFEKNLQSEQEDRYLHIYKAQALFGLKRYEHAIASLKLAGSLANEIPSIMILKAKSYWNLNEPMKAWQAINKGTKSYPNDFRFPLLQIQYLCELDLFNEAFKRSSDLITQNYSSHELLRLAQLFSKENQNKLSLKILETLNLRFPQNENILSQLAYSYAKEGKILVAATIFEDLARFQQRYFYQAAEMYRRARRYHYALSLNERVLDQKEKFKQKLAIYVAKGDFERAARCEEDLTRLGLLEQEELRYALAYSHFRNHSFKKADEHLRRITQADLFKKTIRLRKELMKCMDDQSVCTT